MEERNEYGECPECGSDICEECYECGDPECICEECYDCGEPNCLCDPCWECGDCTCWNEECRVGLECDICGADEVYEDDLCEECYQDEYGDHEQA